MVKQEKAVLDNISYIRLLSNRQLKIREMIPRWSAYNEFKTGVWDATTKDQTYKIISHPGYTGRLIPNGRTENFLVNQGQQIWKTFQEEGLQPGETYKDYFRVLRPRLKRSKKSR